MSAAGQYALIPQVSNSFTINTEHTCKKRQGTKAKARVRNPHCTWSANALRTDASWLMYPSSASLGGETLILRIQRCVIMRLVQREVHDEQVTSNRCLMLAWSLEMQSCWHACLRVPCAFALGRTQPLPLNSFPL